MAVSWFVKLLLVTSDVVTRKKKNYKSELNADDLNISVLV